MSTDINFSLTPEYLQALFAHAIDGIVLDIEAQIQVTYNSRIIKQEHILFDNLSDDPKKAQIAAVAYHAADALATLCSNEVAVACFHAGAAFAANLPHPHQPSGQTEKGASAA